jgi:hypothetical protein
MSKKRNDLKDERGAVVLAPQPVKRGCFALLVPDDMKWEVRGVAGGYRLDFRPMTPRERARRLREWRQL